jgi:Trypsin-like peptidase domain
MLLVFENANSQMFALSPERIQRVQNATVRLSVDGQNIGTGFIINGKCQIITCYHVIEPYLNTPSPSDAFKDSTSGIVITFNGWRSFFSKKLKYTLSKYKIDSLKYYDIAVLEPIAIPPIKFDTLSLGNWEGANEGQMIYTCGFPLTMREPFTSIGMLSKKVDETFAYRPDTSMNFIIHHKHYAYLDLTMNRGNSGSAVILLGKTFEDDKIIGIGEFIVSAANKITEDALNNYSKLPIGKDTAYGKKIKDILYGLLYSAENTSNGISGCSSIEYVKKFLIKN